MTRFCFPGEFGSVSLITSTDDLTRSGRRTDPSMTLQPGGIGRAMAPAGTLVRMTTITSCARTQIMKTKTDSSGQTYIEVENLRVTVRRPDSHLALLLRATT